ncbi:YeiH family protein [Leeuwenhoekiella sp. NPDC079379]|uniref:YeiH family protein n=1 Tax=Leeuwenhoekiella sp. NPDC079379 TaxID=3364122 RepID=UPI0037C81068
MNYSYRLFYKSISAAHIIYVILPLLCLTTLISAPIALLLGVIATQMIENPFANLSHKLIQLLLKAAVIGLGFGMNIESAVIVGKEGFSLTAVSIICTLGLGLILGRFLKIDHKIAKLISSGTSICGGSAIAAISPLIRANTNQISIAIGVVFLLNAVALFIFPPLGHLMQMTQHQFGVWCAIAIHDTSSVVGAANVYGDEALQVATTVKLARALWIIPVSLLFAVFSKTDTKKIKIPYFIGLFVLSIILNTYIPQISSITPHILFLSKLALVLVLFLVGNTLNFRILKEVGVKPVILAVALWIFIASTSLVYIL